MKDGTLLGVDIGASSLKATLVAAGDGRVLASASQPLHTQRPQPGWSEQDPDEWYQALCRAVPQALAGAGLAAGTIGAMAISAGAHTPVLLDEHDRVLRPAILWNDQRSAGEAAELRRRHDQLILTQALNRVNATWTLAMLAWLQRHEPATVRRVRRLLLAKDYLRWRLTGDGSTDFSDAVGTLLVDAGRRAWSAELCALIDWPPATLPPLRRATEQAGVVGPAAARASGLPAGLPVMVGSNDTTVELLGAGAIGPGRAALKLATSGVLYLTVDRPLRLAPISCYPHLVDGLYYLASGTNACAAAHRWALELLHRPAGEDYAAMDQQALGAPPGSAGLLFHPYLQGERAPYWDPSLRADFIGLTLQHGRAHLARAVFEGLSCSLRDLIEDARGKGLTIDHALLLGGGARSRAWRQILADVSGLPLTPPVQGDASFGSALLAGIGNGIFADSQDAVTRCVRYGDGIFPDPRRHAFYDELFALYRDTQQVLAPFGARLAALAARAGHFSGGWTNDDDQL